MPEEKKKAIKLLAFWLFGTVVIVFAAITAYIAAVAGGGIGTAISAGLPIWGITAVAAIIIFVGYYLYSRRKG